jgi:arylformamidase
VKAALRASLDALGRALSPALIQRTREIMSPLVPAADPAVLITRDQRYGPDERNRLDVFRQGATEHAPVMAFIHGGGFVMGDKTTPGSPFFDNVGQWAAKQGWVGVTMTYRLAPAHRWPSGPEDMAHAVSWMQAHISNFGGDPRKIFLVGQSAGAAHVAAYVAHDRFHRASAGIAGAVLISGVLDLSPLQASPYTTAYFGGDDAAVREAASIDGLVATRVPLLFSISEFDPPDFHDQAARLSQAWYQQKRFLPPMVYLDGQNHISPAQSIGTAEDQLARSIADFVGAVSAASHQPKA